MKYYDERVGRLTGGNYVLYNDHAAIVAELQEQVKALAAEKERYLVECAAAKIAIQYWKSGRTEFTLHTPATDEAIREIKAQAFDEFAAGQRGLAEVRTRQCRPLAATKAIGIAEMAEFEAAQLRAKPEGNKS